MEHIVINCAGIRSREDLHRVLSEALHFPQWYGRNLDALYDCLTSLSGKVTLEHWDEAQQNLGAYGLAAKKVLAKAALENTALELTL